MTLLVFGFEGVVSDDPSAEEGEGLVRSAGVAATAFWPAYWRHRRSYETGDLTAEMYWTAVADDAEFALDRLTMRRLVRLDVASRLRPRVGVLDLLETLGLSRRYRLALLSNAAREIARGVRESPVGSLVEDLIFSCDTGLAKPDEACFEAAAAALGTSFEEIVFVDRPETVTAADALGIRTVHFVNERQLRADLVEAVVGGPPSQPGALPLLHGCDHR